MWFVPLRSRACRSTPPRPLASLPAPPNLDLKPMVDTALPKDRRRGRPAARSAPRVRSPDLVIVIFILSSFYWWGFGMGCVLKSLSVSYPWVFCVSPAADAPLPAQPRHRLQLCLEGGNLTRPSKETIGTVSLQLSRQLGTNPLARRPIRPQSVPLLLARRLAPSRVPQSVRCREIWERVRHWAPALRLVPGECYWSRQR